MALGVSAAALGHRVLAPAAAAADPPPPHYAATTRAAAPEAAEAPATAAPTAGASSRCRIAHARPSLLGIAGAASAAFVGRRVEANTLLLATAATAAAAAAAVVLIALDAGVAGAHFLSGSM